jgi:hypothetical protein
LKKLQIGLFITAKDDYIDLGDDLAIKVALAKGMWYYLAQNPTLENALIYLHDSNAINSFKDNAIAEKYHPSFFDNPYYLGVWKKLWDKVPESLKKLPQLNQYKAVGEFMVERILNHHFLVIILNYCMKQLQLIF